MVTARRRVRTASTGAALLGIGAVAAGAHLVVGDTYCGTVFYDSNRHGACGDRLATQATVVALLGFLGLAAIAVAALSNVPRSVVLRRIGMLALSVIAAGLALVAANRALEPSDEAYCGSVLNRHRTYEAAFEQRCDDVLRPAAEAALLAAIVSAMVAGGAVVLGFRRPPVQ